MDKRERDTMKKKNLQRKQRLLAVVLSVMLFAGLLPGSLSQVLAASDEYEDCCIAEVAGDEPDGVYESETLKADQSLTFSEETVKLEYGATTYVQVANAVESQDAADGKGYGTGAVTYRLTDNALGAQIDEKAIAHTEAIILSMTPLERENPQILNASRKKRIAAGCGLEVVDVNRLLKQFDMMQQLTKQMTRGRLSKMGGGGLGSRMHGFGRKKRLK